MHKFIKTYIKHIFIVGIITLVFLTIYGEVQQDLRQSANDPQIQAAEDVSTEISSGIQPQQIVSTSNQIDMAKALDPFIIIFGASDQTVVASTAQLNGITPIPPSGVFTYAKEHGEDRFTWQPQNGVREAAVITYANASTSSYFVLVGRSLREVEARENSAMEIALAAWLIALIGYIGYVMLNRHLPKKDA